MKTFLFLTALVACSVPAMLSAQQTAATPFPRGPALSEVSPTSIVVSWTSAHPAQGIVQFGKTLQYGHKAADNAVSTFHSVELKGLTANTLYHYRAAAGPDTSADFSFTTGVRPGQPFVFTAYGDTRSDHAAHVEVLRRMLLVIPRFAINTGDLVARNTDENWDDYFTDVCKTTTFAETVPIYASTGNHEEGAMYYANEVLPRNNPQDTESYYSFNYGGVHFIALDSQIPYQKGSPQYTWLLSDLGSTSARRAKFRVAFWHVPPYSTSIHGSDLKIRSELGPVMEEYGVNVVFNGHDHCYERTIPINGTTYIVTGGGGAPLYDLQTDSGWMAYREKAHHFCRVEVAGNTMKIAMIRVPDGAVRDSVTLTGGALALPAGRRRQHAPAHSSHPAMQGSRARAGSPSAVTRGRGQGG